MTTCDNQSEADMILMWFRLYTPTWKRRLTLVGPHWQRTTSLRPEGWDASPSVWWLSGQITLAVPTHYLSVVLFTCLFDFLSTLPHPAQLLICLFDNLFSCVDIILFICLVVCLEAQMCISNCLSSSAGLLPVLHTTVWWWICRSSGWVTSVILGLTTAAESSLYRVRTWHSKFCSYRVMAINLTTTVAVTPKGL